MDHTAFPAEVQLESRPCPNGCPPEDEFVLAGTDRINGVPGLFRIVRCGTCALMRTDPRPTPDTIGAYYPSSYAPYRSTASARPAKVLKWRHHAKARVARFFGRDLRRLPDIPPGQLLEVGCASGDYLLQMRARGWRVEGIEFSDTPASAARQLGLAVQTGSVETAAPPSQPADVIAAWNVLEHFHDPVHALRRMREWVQPQGYLVGVVPDASAFDLKLFGAHWYSLHLPQHLYHLTPPTLKQLLARGGWQLERLRWQPTPNNLLNTMEWWATDAGRPRTLALVRWVKTAKRASGLRRWLGWLLGITHQSGRMEFHARPSPEFRP